jgi:hypothetical protein
VHAYRQPIMCLDLTCYSVKLFNVGGFYADERLTTSPIDDVAPSVIIGDDRRSTVGGGTCNGNRRSDARSSTSGSANAERHCSGTDNNVSTITDVARSGCEHFHKTDSARQSSTFHISPASNTFVPLHTFGSPTQPTTSDWIPSGVTSSQSDAANHSVASCYRRRYCCSHYDLTASWPLHEAMTSSADFLRQPRCLDESCTIGNLVKSRLMSFDDDEVHAKSCRNIEDCGSRGIDFLTDSVKRVNRSMMATSLTASRLQLMQCVPPLLANRHDVTTTNDVLLRAAESRTVPFFDSSPQAMLFQRPRTSLPLRDRRVRQFDELQDGVAVSSVLDNGTKLASMDEWEKLHYAEYQNALSQPSENNPKYFTNEISRGRVSGSSLGDPQMPADHQTVSLSTLFGDCRLQFASPFSALTRMYDILLQRIAMRCPSSASVRRSPMTESEENAASAARGGAPLADAHMPLGSNERPQHVDIHALPKPTSTSSTTATLFRPYLDLSPSSSTSHPATDDDNTQLSRPITGRNASSYVHRGGNSTSLRSNVRLYAKKYRCDVCGRTFSRSNTLVTHRVCISFD